MSPRELGVGWPFPGRLMPERLTGSDLQAHWPPPGTSPPFTAQPPRAIPPPFLTSHSDPAWPWSSAAGETQ